MNHNLDFRNLVLPVSYAAGAVVFGFLLSFMVLRIASASARRGGVDTKYFSALLRRIKGPIRLLFPLLTLQITFTTLVMHGIVLGLARHALGILSILGVSWLAIRLAFFTEDFVGLRYDFSAKDNLKARKVQTQIRFFRQLATVIVLILAAAVILMTVDRVRQLGTAILASAGLVGVVAGFAAQRSLGTLFAGFQIALTQPIRLDDVVIVEGEWGRIEEITLTYVVVKIWDLRRLVLPITYFLEKPIQNWTRVSSELLGTVLFYVDYSIPVEAVRAELGAVLKKSKKWDRKVWGLEVTGCTERTVELRAVMSAEDAGKLWDLRCEIREKLLVFIRHEFPDGLPKTRAELSDRRAGEERKSLPGDFSGSGLSPRG